MNKIFASSVLFMLLILPTLYAVENIVIADFESALDNTFPEGWGIKKGLWYTDGKDNQNWKIKSENGNKFLNVISKNVSETIGKKSEYNLKKFKFIKWRWRVHLLPKGGDETSKDTNDSAAGVYLVFPGFGIPYTIKYVWSSTKQVGTILSSPFSSRTKVFVLRSGEKELGQWVEEKRNVFEDYKTAFGKDADKDVQGIALLSDSDNTHSEAKADYDSIIATTE